MKIVISDLHIGSEDCNAFELEEFLLKKARLADEVLLCGDVFDMWVASIDQLCARHKSVVEALFDLGNVTWITGNHDDAAINLSPLLVENVKIQQSPVVEKINEKHVLLIHGDEFDQLLENSICWAKIASWIDNLINRKYNFSLAKWIRKSKYAKELLEKQKDLILEKYGANFGYVISGHTHVPGIDREKSEECVLVNIGDWVEHNTYVVLDGDNEPELLEWGK